MAFLKLIGSADDVIRGEERAVKHAGLCALCKKEINARQQEEEDNEIARGEGCVVQY